jgi:hypothetical protein
LTASGVTTTVPAPQLDLCTGECLVFALVPYAPLPAWYKQAACMSLRRRCWLQMHTQCPETCCATDCLFCACHLQCKDGQLLLGAQSCLEQ